MSTIVRGHRGYDVGVHIVHSDVGQLSDTYRFSVSNEDYVAFKVNDKLFFGNISHGKTHEVMISGKKHWVYGTRWICSERSPDERVRSFLPQIKDRISRLPNLEVKNDVNYVWI